MTPAKIITTSQDGLWWGGGVFDAEVTHRKTVDLIPNSTTWFNGAVSSFAPDDNYVRLEDGTEVGYRHLVVAPGLMLDWDGVEGLNDALGQNGVTSNYRYDLAPYTWELVQDLQKGRAVFTQPPMPIKCAGAPQKALYLSASHWYAQRRIEQIETHFYNAAPVLFGVADYVPALMEYMQKYQAQLHFQHKLVKVDGAAQKAWFERTTDSGVETIATDFDLLHVCPPQRAPDFVKQSGLADAAGWLDVNPSTLQQVKYPNIWGAGDIMNTTNAKTMAAARKQAPVVAQNIVNALQGLAPSVLYDGYGSCPLTVEHGKIVLAEFGYGSKLLPTFANWLNDGTKASRQAWFLKKSLLPTVYWHAMLKGREWLAKPKAL